MNARKMTDGTLLFLRESIKNKGRAVADKSGSRRRALMDRGFMTWDGYVTSEGNQASIEEASAVVLPCARCGKPVRCLHTIPVGDEKCGKCGAPDKRTARGSYVQDRNFHGDDREMDV